MHQASETCSAPGIHLAHSAKPVIPRDRLIRLHEVESLTGTKKTTIYDLMKLGKFPARIRLHARMSVWSEAAVLQWVQDQIKQAGEVAA